MISNITPKILTLAFLLFTNLTFGMDKQHFFAQSDSFFHQSVEDGLVKYKQIGKNTAEIQELVSYVSKADLSSFNSMENLAFYINAYNLLVIKQVVDNYPIESPMSIPGFFDVNKKLVAGEKLTLNDLENKKIRTYKDARIHFVLVCAAKGCPKLANFSYQADKLEDQLTQRTELALNDPAFLKRQETDVQVSEIFNWYRQDFGESDKDLVIFINKYRKNPLPEKSKLNYYTYDWMLNESK